MQFGVFDHLDRNELPLHVYYEHRLQMIEAYDQAGFAAYHVAEHHATPLGMAPSPSVFLAAIAQRTRKLRFGPLVYALPFYNPLRLAEEICMLDHLSCGRLEIGFGRGASPIEMDYYGLTPAEAQSMYAEALEVVIRALREKTLTFEGKHYRYSNVPMEIGPYQRPHPPIWYGAHTSESAERAARNGLNIVSNDSPPKASAVIGRYRDVWRELHGDTALPMMGLVRFIVVAETDAAALAVAHRAYPKWRKSFTHLYSMHGKSPMLGERASDFDTFQDREKLGVAGSPQTVASYLKAHIEETGTNYLVGQFAFGDLTLPEVTRSVELFRTRVMPTLRDIKPLTIIPTSTEGFIEKVSTNS